MQRFARVDDSSYCQLNRTKNTMRSCCWIVVFCASFALGCGDKDVERPDSDGNDTKITSDDFPTDSAGKKEGQHRAKTDLRPLAKRPDGMPLDVPMYPYVRIKLAPGETQAKMMVIETDDAFDDVRSYYVEEFEKNGWKTLHNAPQAIVVEKGDRKTSVSIQKVASITRIVMNFTGQ